MAEQNLAKDLANLNRFIGCRVVRGPDWKWSKQDGKFELKILIENF